jgi:hypothetical protein
MTPNLTSADVSKRLLELAERCEAATGRGRALEESIAIALGWKPYEFEDENDYHERGWHSPGNPMPHSSIPRWTASLGAAMILVPEGWWAVVDTKGRATLFPERGSGSQLMAKAETPALALCAAALRARAVS